MWSCLRLVYLWVFDLDSVRQCLISGILWQFAGWQKALHCLKLDQRRECLKSGRPAGRRSEETPTLARAIVKYTVAAGSYNFSLYMFFFILLSSPPLIFLLGVLNASVKGLWGFIWFWQKRHLVFVPSFICLLGFKAGLVCAQTQWCTFPLQCTHSKVIRIN